MFISNVLSSILATPPSVVQLQKIHDTFPTFGRRDKVFGALTAMLTTLEREIGINIPLSPETGAQEDLQTEVERTRKSPEMGDQVSVNTITPNTANLNLSLPKVSGGGNVNPPNNRQYASLFPFDTTGTAIANRAGIMGLT